jgi:hypothetical protein
MWRYDAARSAANPVLLWSRKLPPVRQAWPLEVRHRLDFDASYEPVVMCKLLLLGSPNDGSVAAYDTQSGAEAGGDRLLCRRYLAELRDLCPRAGPLAGSAPWTHEACDAARTFCAQDELVKPPLGVLWYGDHNDFVLRNHGYDEIRPQVVGGRVFAFSRLVSRQ